MTLLPVVARELRVASRRRGTYWGRVVAGGIALMLSAWISLVEKAVTGGRNGQLMFFALAVPALGFAFLAGLLYAADTVSAEKRDGTLGLLFLTDLRGHDVTLGKLTGNSLGAVYGLVTMLPFLALTLLLGGITAGDYGRMTLLLLATLFTSLATGVLASVLASDVRQSVLLAFVLMLGVFFGVPTACGSLSWICQKLGTPLDPREWPWHLTPFAGFIHAAGPSFPSAPRVYWISVAFTGGVGLFSMLAAGWILPHRWQEAGSVRRRRGLAGWLDQLRFAQPGSRHRFRTSILQRAPTAWLSCRHWMRPWLPWLFLGVVAAVTHWLSRAQNSDGWDVEVSFGLSVGVHAILKIWMANEAPRQLLEDRRSGALELILSTPLSAREIVSGHRLALQRMFLGPMTAVLLFDLACLSFQEAIGRDGGPPFVAVIWLLRMGLLVADLWTLAWAGMWAGITGRGRAATSGLVSRVLTLPWVLWFGLATLMSFSSSRPSNEDTLAWSLIGLWSGIGLLNDFVWWQRARSGLEHRFREMATRRPEESRRWFFWRGARSGATQSGSA
ncbi:MAG: ABC transporter permease subunit [Verrucomicrobiae bacterium]|nr:ABC transporter permease subunit [Verrucomicrobiae bacterium]